MTLQTHGRAVPAPKPPVGLREVEAIVRYLHHRRFHRLWMAPTRAEEWTGKYAVTQCLAFLFAVLHQQTGKHAYLTHAKRYLLDLDRGYHFTALFCGKAFELLQPHLSAQEQADFGRRWVADVPASLQHYVLRGVDDPADLVKLEHVTNHALCACVYADYARALFPEQSMRYRFTDITDRVWRAWWARREFWEQASNYEGFAEFYLCAWAALRGESAAFDHSPSVQNLLARNARIVSPAGIVAAYGDSGHNEHAAAWVALFAKVARQTGDGAYQRLADAIFAFLRRSGLARAARELEAVLAQDITNARMQYAQYLHAIAWLGMAALERAVPAAPRTDPAGAIARLPWGHRLTPKERAERLKTPLVPCQVALTGGPGDPRRRTYLLASVGPALVHDHADAGAILLLSRGDCCLLGTNGYLQRELAYHHTFYAQRHGARYPDDTPGAMLNGDPACAGVIEELSLQGTSSYVRLHFDRYHGLPLALRREIILDAAGAVTLIDRATACKAGYCGGQLFHAQSVTRLAGGGYRLRTDTLRAMCGLALPNAAGALRVDFLSPAGDIAVASLRLPTIYAAPIYRAYPCNRYTKVWARSYTARKCLRGKRELPAGSEVVLITRLAYDVC